MREARAGSIGTAGPAYLGRELVEAELRAEGAAPNGLVLHVIDSDPVASDEIVSASAVAQPPTIITRAQWGADESWRDDSGGECDGTPDYVDDIQMGFVHHTAGESPVTSGDSAAIIRGIYDFHVHSNGWCDVGYNFFVDPFGQVFEGRFGGIRRTAIGGHTSGFNSVSTGVSVLGDYTSTRLTAGRLRGAGRRPRLQARLPRRRPEGLVDRAGGVEHQRPLAGGRRWSRSRTSAATATATTRPAPGQKLVRPAAAAAQRRRRGHHRPAATSRRSR